MKKKYVIFAPQFDEIRGGAIALHKLCHLINSHNREAFIFPLFENFELNQLNFKSVLLQFIRRTIRWKIKPFRTNPSFQTPVIRSLASLGPIKDVVVIYPEVTFGNPIGAFNVVRWLLHNPGFLKNKVYYGANELHFKINSHISDFSFPGATLSALELRVTHFPLDLYRPSEINTERKGSAYCLRKGRHKDIQHDLSDSILIDGKSHAEVSKIFKQVKTFISYDTYTAYSRLAALSGCDSIVIPDQGVTLEKWHPNPDERNGIAYGFDQLEHARTTRHLVVDKFNRIERNSGEIAVKFIQEVEGFFNN
jgi:hypothetical protein